jgi:hypothetical protein
MRTIYESRHPADFPLMRREGRAATEQDTRAQEAREQAIERIRRRRRFHRELAVSGLAMAFLVVIWALSEYHNAHGWPAHGFSQGSGIHEVWNFWIVYPLVGWLLIEGGRYWGIRRREPISEDEIRREMQRPRN